MRLNDDGDYLMNNLMKSKNKKEWLINQREVKQLQVKHLQVLNHSIIVWIIKLLKQFYALF